MSLEGLRNLTKIWSNVESLSIYLENSKSTSLTKKQETRLHEASINDLLLTFVGLKTTQCPLLQTDPPINTWTKNTKLCKDLVGIWGRVFIAHKSEKWWNSPIDTSEFPFIVHLYQLTQPHFFCSLHHPPHSFWIKFPASQIVPTLL